MVTGDGIRFIYANAFMVRFGRSCGARVQENPLPLFLDFARAVDMLRMDRLVSRVTQTIENADVFVFSVSTVTEGLPSAPHLYGNYLWDADYAYRDPSGVV